MSRKLYPSEARKIRAMLGEGFSDLEISRVLHVAKSIVTNFRNGDQVDSESMDQGQLSSDNLEQESKNDKPLTAEEETDLQIYEMIHSGYNDSEIAQEVGISEDTVRNYRGDQKNASEQEPEGQSGAPGSNRLNVIEGKKHAESKRMGEGITFIGGKKHIEPKEESKEKESEQEEDVYMCDNCGYQQNTLFSTCPKCHYDLDWDEKSKSGTKEEDEYQCYACDYIQGAPFSECPKCGTSNDFGE